MKKLALTFAIVLGISLCTYAQGGFFGYGEAGQEEETSYNIAWYSFYQNQDEIDNGLFGFLRSGTTPNLPDHLQNTNQNAPLGGGALLLIGFGAAYAAAKRRKE
jgi:hypothetical protein